MSLSVLVIWTAFSAFLEVDEMDGMSGVGRGELGRTSTQGFLKGETMLRAKS
jgi:hypothetical protein